MYESRVIKTSDENKARIMIAMAKEHGFEFKVVHNIQTPLCPEGYTLVWLTEKRPSMNSINGIRKFLNGLFTCLTYLETEGILHKAHYGQILMTDVRKQ